MNKRLNSNTEKHSNLKFAISVAMALLALVGVLFQHFSLKGSESQLEVAKSDLKTAQANLGVAEGQLAAAKEATEVARKDLENAVEQTQIATEQASAALEQVKISNLGRFRNRVRELTELLVDQDVTNRERESDESSVGLAVNYVVAVPNLVDEERERLDNGLIRVNRVCNYNVETKMRNVSSRFELLEDVLLAITDSDSYLQGLNNFEAACALEPMLASEITASEYVILASFAYAFSGSSRFEAYLEKAIRKTEDTSGNLQNVLLLTQLAALYYRHHPRLDKSQGEELFRKAQNYFDSVPDQEKSLLAEAEFWTQWALAEYSVGDVVNASKRQEEAWSKLMRIELPPEKKTNLLLAYSAAFAKAKVRIGDTEDLSFDFGIFDVVAKIDTSTNQGEVRPEEAGAPAPSDSDE